MVLDCGFILVGIFKNFIQSRSDVTDRFFDFEINGLAARN